MFWLVQQTEIVLKHHWLNDSKYVVHAFLDGRLTVIEFEIAITGSAAHDLLADDRSCLWSQKDKYGLGYFATKEVCLMLKLSHRFLRNSPHFWKTMKDIAILKAHLPQGLSDWLIPILKKREVETYTYSHPKLNTTKENFFKDDNIVYTYDHDELHQIVKLLDKPAYEYFKPNENEVYCSSELFANADNAIKIAAVYEESCVLALERALVPFEDKIDFENAFLLALSKVCSSITSGWFREYAYNNAYSAIELFEKQEVNFYQKFLTARDNNMIQPLVNKIDGTVTTN